MRLPKVLAATVLAGALALGAAPAAGAQDAPASAKAAGGQQVPTSVEQAPISAAAPSCVKGSEYVWGDGERWGVRVTNNCNKAKRIKIKVGLWSNSKCKKIPPHRTFPNNYKWFGDWYVPTYYKGIASC